jgi:hypothetical protein
MPYAKLVKIGEKSKYPYEPQNYGNHHHGIQDSLDLALHGNEAVDKPKKQAYDA